MASLYDLLCYHSLTSTDPFLEELLPYLLTRFHSHIFNYMAHGHSSDDESARSIDYSVSAFHSDDSTYFSQILLSYSSLCNSNFVPRGQARDSEKEPPAENDRWLRRGPEDPK